MEMDVCCYFLLGEVSSVKEEILNFYAHSNDPGLTPQGTLILVTFEFAFHSFF